MTAAVASPRPPDAVNVVSDADTVILPPPSASNPLPSLGAALRLDNRDQLLRLLQLEGVKSRQLLVFQDDALRTLLLRQVLNDPHANAHNSSTNKQTKKNWDNSNSFQYPKSLQGSIVGTRILQQTTASSQRSSSSSSSIPNSTIFSNILGGGTEVALSPNKNPFEDEKTEKDVLVASDATLLPIGQHVDVVTYFLRSQSVAPTTLLATAVIPKWKGAVQHRLVYLPQPTALIHQVLVDSGLAAHSHVQIKSLQLDLFPLEADILSMEYPAALAEATLEGTPSTLIATCARTLLKLQDVVGPIPRIQSLGTLGEEVVARLCSDAVQEYLNSGSSGSDGASSSSSATPVPPNHLAMMILDRQVDLVTPMVTPLTYEGLLDEVLGITAGYLHVPLQTINPDETTTTTSTPPKSKPSNNNATVALGVHAGDSLFAEVRDQHVEKFGSFLQNQAKALQESHANFTSKGTKKDLSEIHQFVKQIPMFTQNLRSLTNHIHLAELIKAHTEHFSFREQWSTERSILEGESALDTLEEWICSHHSIHKILRGLVLQSICGGGLKANRYDHLRALIVQGYGYEYLLKLHDLEKLGWIRRKDTLWMDSASSAFPLLRKSLILIHAEVDTVEPDDISYASSGYAPLTVRLVQSAVQGWTKTRRQEVLQQLPGRLIDVQMTMPPQDLSSLIQQSPRDSLGDYAKSSGEQQERYKPTLIVFFVGGLSYMEVAALRFLSKRPTFPFRIVMVTTQMINGNTLLQQTSLE